jgi:hypothetical protein
MFVASLFHINQHHDYKTLGPTDTVRQESKSDGENMQRDQDSMILLVNHPPPGNLWTDCASKLNPSLQTGSELINNN